MSVEIKIPSVGESITEVVVSQWMKQDGDWVEKDEEILELETDKVNQEVTSPESGILRISAQEGETLEIGDVAGHIEPGEKPADAGKKSEKAPEPARKQEEEAPKEEEKPAAEKKEPSKPAEEKPAPKEKEAAPRPEKTTKPEPTPPPADRRPPHKIASPMALRIAAEQEVSVYDIQGTGRDGLVTSDDVRTYVEKGGARRTSRAAASPPLLSPPTSSSPQRITDDREPQREVTRERMSQLRKRIAARLVEAQHTAAMLTTFNECDMTEVMAVRAKYKEPFKEKHEVGLGFMSFFLRAAVEALRAYPRVNASIDEDEIVYHHYMDIGVAVGTDRGLVVPVVRNVEKLGFAGIESAIRDYASRAQKGKLSLEDLTGGTFSITNGGVYGSMMSTPILNPPQSAILGMHNITRRPVAIGDKVEIRPMMYLALSYDHRIVDGKEAVSFLVRIKECIENPERMLLDI